MADAAAAGRVRAQIEALLLAALAQQAAGQQPAAVAALAQAVQLAEPTGFVRLFVEEAAALAPLLPLVRYALQLVCRITQTRKHTHEPSSP